MSKQRTYKINAVMAVTITESKYGPIAQIATMAVTADKIDKRKSEYKKLVAKKIKVK